METLKYGFEKDGNRYVPMKVYMELGPEKPPWRRFDYNSRDSTGHVGLLNAGATCYMNSLLQVRERRSPNP